MTTIRYLERSSQKEQIEKVYGDLFLKFLYPTYFLGNLVAFFFLPLVSKLPLFSLFYGFMQKTSFSKKKIIPFIKKYQIDTSEFLHPVSSFRSFNDFFIRKLKPSARPIAPEEEVAILPADGRYLFFENIEETDGFLIKGKKFSLDKLLLSIPLAEKYRAGSMVIARLCPVDYHRFHFPCAALASASQLINGPLYSVNPIALKQNIHFLSENKRMITRLDSKQFGSILFIEVGATNVGSIHQTYTPNSFCAKGDEKGFFSFGGSCIILLFEPKKICFDSDLLSASKKKLEIYALYGESMGRAIKG